MESRVVQVQFHLAPAPLAVTERARRQPKGRAPAGQKPNRHNNMRGRRRPQLLKAHPSISPPASGLSRHDEGTSLVETHSTQHTLMYTGGAPARAPLVPLPPNPTLLPARPPAARRPNSSSGPIPLPTPTPPTPPSHHSSKSERQ